MRSTCVWSNFGLERLGVAGGTGPDALPADRRGAASGKAGTFAVARELAAAVAAETDCDLLKLMSITPFGSLFLLKGGGFRPLVEAGGFRE
eukprot:scaffold87414_cov36-Prasinocladus_malaysianus.AAC.2